MSSTDWERPPGTCYARVDVPRYEHWTVLFVYVTSRDVIRFNLSGDHMLHKTIDDRADVTWRDAYFVLVGEVVER